MFRPLFPLMLAASLLTASCAQSRHDQVRSAANDTQALLESQLADALTDKSPARQPRIDRLSSIRYQLSAANVALGVVPFAIEQPAERETAYTFLEEVYATLAWNARIPPDQPIRPLPANPMPSKLNFSAGR